MPESSLHSGDSFQDGFPLISREHYQNLLKHSAAWFFDSEKAENEVNNYFSDENSWFELLSSFDLSDSHLSKGWQLNDEDQQTINTIRHFFLSYPRLMTLYYTIIINALWPTLDA